MFDQVALPEPYEVDVYGSGKSRQARELYRSGMPVDTIVIEAQMVRGEVTRALRQIRGYRYAIEKAARDAAVAEVEALVVTGCSVVFDGPMRCSL